MPDSTWKVWKLKISKESLEHLEPLVKARAKLKIQAIKNTQNSPPTLESDSYQIEFYSNSYPNQGQERPKTLA